MRRVVCGCLLLAVCLARPWAQVQSPVVKTVTAGVVIDVSVLDNKGQPILDLGQGDFEVTEDGKSQHLLAVTLVNAGVARPAGASSLPTGGAVLAPPARSDSGESEEPGALRIAPSVTAIVFDRLSPETRDPEPPWLCRRLLPPSLGWVLWPTEIPRVPLGPVRWVG